MNKYLQKPEYILDLHGYTTSEAKEILRELLRDSNYSYIRIITGKGLNSENGPVLPDFVKSFLNMHNIRFSRSKIGDGGEGALEVFLKK